MEKERVKKSYSKCVKLNPALKLSDKLWFDFMKIFHNMHKNHVYRKLEIVEQKL
ncbi:hypothetical protein S225a_26090 [Candidatus Brocadiaceae bacterium S225]|uniref:Uncharacterized protein n=1 Tax=Candidatus Scalindua brodae TaxID=237368 RepID=A0A0B0EL27_9BACT|nr:MAG: hypothetical protein SCABRO_00454 [Candidatus Scalindua brodae]TWU29085.1 hypothetical protein S225a_26090 [Candidatus Brocadiaceae bacterium S225]